MWCEPSAFPPVLKYTQPAAELACRPAGTAGGAQGEQGILRPCPSSLGGVPGKPEVLLKAVAHPELSLTLRREQDQLMANVPSRIPRRMPTSDIGYPTGLQILSSEKKWLLKGALGRAPAFTPRFLAGLSPASGPLCLIRAFPCFQPSLLPSAVEKKNSFVFSMGNKQAGPVRRSITATQPTTVTHVLSTYCLPGVMCGMGLDSKTMTPHGVDQ